MYHYCDYTTIRGIYSTCKDYIHVIELVQEMFESNFLFSNFYFSLRYERFIEQYRGLIAQIHPNLNSYSNSYNGTKNSVIPSGDLSFCQSITKYLVLIIGHECSSMAFKIVYGYIVEIYM